MKMTNEEQNRLAEELAKLPETIMKKELSILNVANLLETAEVDAEFERAIVMEQITRQKDTDGKFVFTNESARRAEFLIQSKASEELTDKEIIGKNLRKQLVMGKIELTFLVNTLSVTRSIARLVEVKE